MSAYAARRIASAVFVVVGVVIATFLLLHVEPGDPARLVLGEHASPQAIDTLRHDWGLDQSLPSQFGRFLSSLAQGDLGTSYTAKVPTTTLIGQRIWITYSLVGVAALFAVLITIPLAALAASRKDRAPDHAVRALSVVALGLPAFWFGIMLIEIFAVNLHWLPVGGWGDSFVDHVRALILPGLTAAIAIVPILVRSLRVGMVELLDSDFVATARGKGISERRVLLAHVARNALIPTIALLGVNIAFLIGSTVVVEQVFNLNGLGSLLIHAISERDFPVVQSITLVLAASVVLVSLLTDLLAARLDPRIRLK